MENIIEKKCSICSSEEYPMYIVQTTKFMRPNVAIGTKTWYICKNHIDLIKPFLEYDEVETNEETNKEKE